MHNCIKINLLNVISQNLSHNKMKLYEIKIKCFHFLLYRDTYFTILFICKTVLLIYTFYGGKTVDVFCQYK